VQRKCKKGEKEKKGGKRDKHFLPFRVENPLVRVKIRNLLFPPKNFKKR
jgi:hypothetical protein